MPDYLINGNLIDIPWGGSIAGIKTVIIGEGVTNIGGHAFWNHKNLTDVTIPKTVKSIDSYAFYFCENLRSITIPDGVTGIGSFTFSHSGLTSIKLPNSLNIIARDAFSHCDNLTSIVLPENMHTIGNGAFAECKSLVTVTLPHSLQTIEDYAFMNCVAMTDTDFPENVIEIGKFAFYGTGLTDVTLPKSLTAIGDFAFTTTAPVVTFHVPVGMKGEFYLMLFIGIEQYRILDGMEDVSVIDLGDNLYLPGKSVDPNGTLVKVKLTAEQFKQMYNYGGGTNSYLRSLYTRFNDDFDYILALMDTIDTTKGIVQQINHVGNDIQGIGREIFSNADSYGAGPSLKGHIYTPTRDIVNASLGHELCHAYANWIVKTYTIENTIKGKNAGGHWGIMHIVNGGATGALGGFGYIRTVETNSGGVAGKNKYQAAYQSNETNADGSFKYPASFVRGAKGYWESEILSDIELYLMGLKSDKELRDANFRMDVFGGISYDPPEGPWANVWASEYGYFYATEKTSYTIDDIIRLHGPRIPDSKSSKKKFKILTLLFTTDVAKDCREHISQVEWLTGPPAKLGMHENIHLLFDGRLTIDFSGLHNSLKPQYRQLVDGR